MILEPGMTAPDFTAPTDGGKTITLSDYRGQNLVLYFYPKDNTPGCTKQACGFQELMPEFEKLNAAVIGVSKDSPAKHDKFKAKYGLTFPLVSDEDGTICEFYNSWVEKSLYGRKYMGIDRCSFLIDSNGIIRRIWRKVKVKGHIEEVQNALEEINAAE